MGAECRPPSLSCVTSHLCISQSLVMDFIEDNHAVRGLGLNPPDVYRVLRHLVAYRTHNVIGFFCTKKTEDYVSIKNNYTI